MGIKRVGIRDLQKRLSSYLADLKKGDKLVVTKRGMPIARVVPVELPEVPVDEKILFLIAEGVFSWSGRKPPSDGFRASVHGPKTVAELLIEDRD